ncbi:MAG: DUF3326 domain-containing protein [Cyanobacteria bacterium J06639_1]
MIGHHPYTAVMLVPTGIGASVGGYAGDALPIARTLAAAVDRLITHPNVLNGASAFWPIPNALYVEGFGLDRFCQGNLQLRPTRANRVGVVFDCAIEPDLRLRHDHAIQAARATLGLDVAIAVESDRPFGVELTTFASGASGGSLTAPDALLQAAKKALAKGAEALAIVARFPDDIEADDYVQGRGVDPVAGLEAILSHLVAREFGVPCAHAPAIRLDSTPVRVSDRAAAEEIGFTFLPCVLAGLSRAPQWIPNERSTPADISASEVDVAIAPATAFGSPALLALNDRTPAPLFVAIRENTSVMQVAPEQVNIPAIYVSSYLEAIGLVTAHRAGIALDAVMPVFP